MAPTDQPARTGRGGHTVLGDHLAGHDGGDVAVGALVQAPSPGGQVVGDDGFVQQQRIMVDDVEVGLEPDGDAATVGQPATCAGTEVSCRMACGTDIRPSARSRAQYASRYVGKLESQIIP